MKIVESDDNHIFFPVILKFFGYIDDTNRRFVRRIQEVEIGEALKRMKGGKTKGPDGIC